VDLATLFALGMHQRAMIVRIMLRILLMNRMIVMSPY